MIGLPRAGERVKVYPSPGRHVQEGPRPLDSGGRWLAEDGREVIWSEYYLEQYRAGDLLLHEVAPLLPAERAEKLSTKKDKG